MRVLVLSFFLPVFLATSCGSQQPAASPSGAEFGSKTDSVFFSLQRTPCFGQCPAYTFTIYADGGARYLGRTFAPRVGEYTGKVDRASMQALYDRAVSIGFFGFQDKYDGPVTDLPSTIIKVNADGKEKQVVGRVKTPPAFKPFAAFADSLVTRVEWTKVEEVK